MREQVRILNPDRGKSKFISLRHATRLVSKGMAAWYGPDTIKLKATIQHRGRLPAAEANQTSVLDGRTWLHHYQRCMSYGAISL